MKRPASVRAAIAKSREARLRLTSHLRYLRRHNATGYEALVACLRRVTSAEF